MTIENREDELRMKVFEKSSSIVSRKIAGELFLVPLSGDLADMQRLFSLTTVAEFIWERLDGMRSLSTIRDEVAARFDSGKEQIDSDMREFVDELMKEGLIREVVN